VAEVNLSAFHASHSHSRNAAYRPATIGN